MTASKTSLYKLQLIQNVCCRIILHKGKRTPTHEMHTALKLDKLDKRRDIHLSEFCHRKVYSDSVANVGQYSVCTPARNDREIRQRNKATRLFLELRH